MATQIVTGAAGFIGSHVAEALLKQGERVIGIDEVNDYSSCYQWSRGMARD
jgi:UDP-glucose 4-epimerase